MGFTSGVLIEEAMRISVIMYGGMGYNDLRRLPWRDYEVATDIAAKIGKELNGG